MRFTNVIKWCWSKFKSVVKEMEKRFLSRKRFRTKYLPEPYHQQQWRRKTSSVAALSRQQAQEKCREVWWSRIPFKIVYLLQRDVISGPIFPSHKTKSRPENVRRERWDKRILFATRRYNYNFQCLLCTENVRSSLYCRIWKLWSLPCGQIMAIFFSLWTGHRSLSRNCLLRRLISDSRSSQTLIDARLKVVNKLLSVEDWEGWSLWLRISKTFSLK